MIFNNLCYSQVNRVDIKITHTEQGQKLISVKDTSKFEYFYNCSMDNGFRLKPSLKDGIYEIYENDTLSYRAYYLNSKKDSVWTYYYPNGTISSTVSFKNGKEHEQYG